MAVRHQNLITATISEPMDQPPKKVQKMGDSDVQCLRCNSPGFERRGH
jgi:hypothetical protein